MSFHPPETEGARHTLASRIRKLLAAGRPVSAERQAWFDEYERSKQTNGRHPQSWMKAAPPTEGQPEVATTPVEPPPALPVQAPAPSAPAAAAPSTGAPSPGVAPASSVAVPASSSPIASQNDMRDAAKQFAGMTPEKMAEMSKLSGDLGIRSAVEGMYTKMLLAWSAEIKQRGGFPIPDEMIEFGGRCAGYLAEKYSIQYMGPDAACGLGTAIPVGWLWNEGRKLENAKAKHATQRQPQPVPTQQQNGTQQRPPTPAPQQQSVRPDGWTAPDESGS